MKEGLCRESGQTCGRSWPGYDGASWKSARELAEPDYRRRLWPVLATALEPRGLLVFTWHDGGPPAPGQRIESHQVGRHTYTVRSEILESDEESRRLRYVYRITEGEKVISEEELTGRAYWPTGNVLRRELTGAGFTPAEGAEGLLAWRIA